jgi:6-phosphogluconolactonase
MLRGLIGNKAVKWDLWYAPRQCEHTLCKFLTSKTNNRHIFYADERVVPLDHPDSNHNLCKTVLFDQEGVSIPANHINTIKPDDPDFEFDTIDFTNPSEDALETLADEYESKLIAEFAQKDSVRFPVFDLILLGIGEDGHTCSLFPGPDSAISEGAGWVAYVQNSPKPPPNRITLTYAVLNHAARVAFVATGAGKVDVLRTVLDKPEQGLPASRVRPAFPGRVWWFVDDAASAKVLHAKEEFKL